MQISPQESWWEWSRNAATFHNSQGHSVAFLKRSFLSGLQVSDRMDSISGISGISYAARIAA